MPEQVISALVEGGRANAGPPLGPALGPLGINIGQVIAMINEKTKAFEGTTVPVKVIIDPSTKAFRIEVGTPPVSSLIKKEVAQLKGSPRAHEQKIGDLLIDQVIRIARAKTDAVHAKTPQKAVKEVLGTCVTMGVLVEGKSPREVQAEVDKGIYDAKILGKEPLKEVTKEEIEQKKKKFGVVETKPKEEAKKEEAKPAEAPAEAPAKKGAEGAGKKGAEGAGKGKKK